MVGIITKGMIGVLGIFVWKENSMLFISNNVKETQHCRMKELYR